MSILGYEEEGGCIGEVIDSTEDEHVIDSPEEDNIEVNDKKNVQFTGSKINKKRCTLVPIYTPSQLVHLLGGRGGWVISPKSKHQLNSNFVLGSRYLLYHSNTLADKPHKKYFQMTS